MGAQAMESALRELQDFDILDANVHVGPSGIHGLLALEPDGLLDEMDRFGIRRAVVSHFTAEEYDAETGNRALERDANPRLIPAWSALPTSEMIADLRTRRPKAVRLSFAAARHNFSPSAWCSSQLFEFLSHLKTVAFISRRDIEWDGVAGILQDFPALRVVMLDIGYRSDRYLFPLLKRHSNLYFDSSSYLAHRQLEAFVERFGPERIVYGSRLPLYTPGASLAVVATARISDADKGAILGGALRRLLGAA
jgi:predicted TIM-barrel fold metal-dependent hydrolase